MSFIVEIKKSAEKDFLRLNNPIKDRIKKAILSLKEDPLPDGHKKLKNREDYRIALVIIVFYINLIIQPKQLQ